VNELNDMIRRLNSIEGAVRGAMLDVEAACKKQLEQSISAGTSPDGEAWALRKDTQARPLQNALEHVNFATLDNTVIVRLRGVDAAHHRGGTRGRVKRQVIPVDRIPDTWQAAIRRVLVEHFERAASGKK
jgi:hypothetical protein